MLPLLRPNDQLFFKAITFKQSKIDDLVLFKQKQAFVVHRVIYKGKDFLISKGDNNLRSDGKVLPAQVIARVIKIKRADEVFGIDDLYLIQSTLYYQEIIKIKRQLEDSGINYVILKGLPLHLYYDKTHPRRLYADCDILIHSPQLSRAEAVLTKYGYRRVRKELSPFLARLRKHEPELVFLKVVKSFHITIDLHQEVVFMMTEFGSLNGLFSSSLLKQLTGNMLKTKCLVRVSNQSFFILAPKQLVIYLTLHLFHHNCRGAFRYAFLDKIIRHYSFSVQEWQAIGIYAKRYMLESFIAPVFAVLRKHYNTPIPDFFVYQLSNINTNKLFRNELQIFDDETRIEAGVTRFKNILLLSPQPWYKRVFALFKPVVFFSGLWIFGHKVKEFVSSLNRPVKIQCLFWLFVALF